MARRVSNAVAVVAVCFYGVALFVGVDSPVGIVAMISGTVLLIGCVWSALRLFRAIGEIPVPARTAQTANPEETPRAQQTAAEDPRTRSDAQHTAEDKQRAAIAARTLRDAGEFPRKTPPVPIDASEICYHSRPAKLLREAHGGLRTIDRGHLVLTDRRLLFAGTAEFSTIAFEDIHGLRLANNRSFSLLKSKGTPPETFHVEYPLEFLAYLGLVCHKAGIDLPRVARG
jgi:hypothetical protein